MQHLLQISNQQFIGIILLGIFIIIGFILSPAISDDNILEKNDVILFKKISTLHNFLPVYFTEFMIVVTNFGRELFWPLVIGLLFLFGNKVLRKKIIVISIIIVIVILLTSLSKYIVERERPQLDEKQKLIHSDNYNNSYPSGHASVVVAAAVLAVMVLQKSQKRFFISVLLIIEAILVSFSRIYVGIHYPLDVVGGAFLGIGISLLFMNSNITKKIKSNNWW